MLPFLVALNSADEPYVSGTETSRLKELTSNRSTHLWLLSAVLVNYKSLNDANEVVAEESGSFSSA